MPNHYVHTDDCEMSRVDESFNCTCGAWPTAEACDWPAGEAFGFHDDPGEHDPCYVVMPGGAMLVFNHHAGPGVDISRARFVQAACNVALNPSEDWQSRALRAEAERDGAVAEAERMFVALEGRDERITKLERDAVFAKVNAKAATRRAEAERDEAVEIVVELNQMAQGLRSDLRSAHQSRGAGLSEWMRKEDREQFRDFVALTDAAEALLAKLNPPSGGERGAEKDGASASEWRPTHRHVKRGSLYRLVSSAVLQTDTLCADNEFLALYQGADGLYWVRPADEFKDGRFEPLPALGPYCPACQAIPQHGYCKMKGCPMPQPEGE